MIDWKKLGRKLLFPPVWLMVLLTVASAALLAVVFIRGWDTHPVAYVTYVLSFYTLSVVCIFCAMVLPGYVKQTKAKIYAHPLGNRYMTDAVFRTRVSLAVSLGINLLYVAVNLISGALYHSAWFYILAGYYSVLAIMRYLLVSYTVRIGIGKDQIGEHKRARLCAWILLSVNLMLSGAVLMILYQNRGYEYHGMLIYVMAAYTFYITTYAIINLFRYRKYHSPVMSAAKVISLAAALVSMLSLETAMFSSFGGEMAVSDQRIFIAATGAGVSVIVITMSVYTIVRSTKEIKKEKAK